MLVLYRDEIAVVEGFISDGRWHLPGGGCKRNESYVDAAVRELREETGLMVAPGLIKQVTSHEMVSKEFGHPYMVYSVKLGKKEELRYQKYELLDAKWVNIAELTNQTSGEVVMNALYLYAQQN